MVIRNVEPGESLGAAKEPPDLGFVREAHPPATLEGMLSYYHLDCIPEARAWIAAVRARSMTRRRAVRLASKVHDAAGE